MNRSEEEMTELWPDRIMKTKAGKEDGPTQTSSGVSCLVFFRYDSVRPRVPGEIKAFLLENAG